MGAVATHPDNLIFPQQSHHTVPHGERITSRPENHCGGYTVYCVLWPSHTRSQYYGKKENITANKRVQGTRHKVSGPLTRDVRKEK